MSIKITEIKCKLYKRTVDSDGKVILFRRRDDRREIYKLWKQKVADHKRKEEIRNLKVANLFNPVMS